MTGSNNYYFKNGEKIPLEESQEDILEPNKSQPAFERDLNQSVTNFLQKAVDTLEDYGKEENTMYYSLDLLVRENQLVLVFNHSKTLPDEIQKRLQQSGVSS